MQQNAIDFLLTVARDKPWLEHLLVTISSFHENTYQTLKIGGIEAPLMAQKSELLGTN